MPCPVPCRCCCDSIGRFDPGLHRRHRLRPAAGHARRRARRAGEGPARPRPGRDGDYFELRDVLPDRFRKTLDAGDTLHLRCRPSCGKAGRCGTALSIRRSSAFSGSGEPPAPASRLPIRPAPPQPMLRATRDARGRGTRRLGPVDRRRAVLRPRRRDDRHARGTRGGGGRRRGFGTEAEANRLGSLAKMVFRTVLQVSDYLQSVSAERAGEGRQAPRSSSRRRSRRHAAIASPTGGTQSPRSPQRRHAANAPTTFNAETAEQAEHCHAAIARRKANLRLTAPRVCVARRRVAAAAGPQAAVSDGVSDRFVTLAIPVALRAGGPDCRPACRPTCRRCCVTA